MSDPVQQDLDVFTQADVYQNKMKFENAVEMDLEEARLGPPQQSKVKQEIVSLQYKFGQSNQMTLPDKIRYLKLKQSITSAIAKSLVSIPSDKQMASADSFKKSSCNLQKLIK